MGLNISLVEYQGKDKDGYLITTKVDKKYAWNNGQYIVRYDFGENVEMEAVCSGLPDDNEIIYRPVDFKAAFEWCGALHGSDKSYIQRLLMTLQSKSTLYLKYSI